MDGLAARAILPVSALARVVVPEGNHEAPIGGLDRSECGLHFLPLEAPLPLGKMLPKFGF